MWIYATSIPLNCLRGAFVAFLAYRGAPSLLATVDEFSSLSGFVTLSETESGEGVSVYHPTPLTSLFQEHERIENSVDVHGPSMQGSVTGIIGAEALHIPVDAIPRVGDPDSSELPGVAGEDQAKGVEGGTTERLRDKWEGRLEPDLRYESTLPYSVYRSGEAGWGWLPGSGDDFGWLSMQSDTMLPRHARSGFDFSFSLHWLNGPNAVPLPPRLYDLVFGYQKRGEISDVFGYDIATSVGLFTDFEGSVREGFRFPGHAVGILHADTNMDLVLGVDIPDRDDLFALPVVGISVRDAVIDGLRMDLVFPRPRVEYAVSKDLRLYMAGRLGGGTWDVEFPDSSEQVITYRDYRIAAGWERPDTDGSIFAVEICWITGRRLELRDSSDVLQMDDAIMLQIMTRR